MNLPQLNFEALESRVSIAYNNSLLLAQNVKYINYLGLVKKKNSRTNVGFVSKNARFLARCDPLSSVFIGRQKT